MMYVLNVLDGKPVELKRLPDRQGSLIWVDLENPSKSEMDAVTKKFKLHPLAVEDALTEQQEPKVDDYRDYLFILAKSIDYDKKEFIQIRRVSFFLSRDFLITVHPLPCDDIEQVKKEITEKRYPSFLAETDFLTYSIIDKMIDGSFPALTSFEDEIEELEDLAIKKPGQKTVSRIMKLKKVLLKFRKVLWPTREFLLQIHRGTYPQIRKKNLIYYKDVYDHVFYLLDLIEGNRDILTGVLDVYLSSISNNLNQVMKILTVLASFVLVPTLIAGIYGMNFRYMPELGWEYGYPFALGLMCVSILLIYIFFRRKGWM